MIEIIIGTLVVLLVGGGVALNWDNLLTNYKGKKLAVLGARAVGKTSLLNFLRTGSVPSEYKQTVTPEKIPSKTYHLKF
jgi:GTPase SAR1 family protein